MSLKIISYNCQSLKAKLDIVSSLLKECDILLLQETLLTNDNNDILDNINTNFNAINIPSVRKLGQLYGRSSGGLAILWKKNSNFKYFPVYGNNRFIGIKIFFGEISYLLLNVYLNCDYRTIESLIEYKENLAEIEQKIADVEYDELIIAGDFNGDPNKGRFFNELKCFIDAFELACTDIDRLPSDSYTYINRNHSCSTSWLDHIVTSKNNIVMNISIMYGYTVEDHIPIKFELMHPLQETYFDSEPINLDGNNIKHYQWDKASESEIAQYAVNLDSLYKDKLYESFLCSELNCKNKSHIQELSNIYCDIIINIELASSNLPTHNKRLNDVIIIGWNDKIKLLHNDARKAFMSWHEKGKPRNGNVFENMKESRKKFKQALKICKKNEQQMKREKFINLYSLSDNKSLFWQEIKKLKKKEIITAINGTDNNNDILNLFKEKFEDFSDLQTTENDDEDRSKICRTDNFYIERKNVDAAICKLAEGTDTVNMNSKHLKHSGNVFRQFLSKMFNSFMRHNFIPQNMLHGEIRPRMKDNTICKTKIENYRPIMKSHMLLKVFEYVILPILTKDLLLCDQQLGYTIQSSCTYTVTIMKEIIMQYNKENSNVHCAMIDLSKAFDEINHDILIDKLLKTSLPKIIVRTIGYMLKNTFADVRFNNGISEKWKINKGSRQGGILSPLLFNFYVKGCIEDIINHDAGCKIGLIKWNVLAYADDIILMAPSLNGLQKLIDTLGESIKKICLKINPKKSKYIVFKKNKKDATESSVKLYDEIIERVSHCKYLGIVLTDDMSNTMDSDRVLNKFLRQYNSMYHRFNFASREIIYHLFKTYSSSFYGIELWYNEKNRNRAFNNVSVGYHKAVKRIAGLCTWDSNHSACEIVGVNIFRHLQAKRMFNFYLSIVNSKNKSMLSLKYYFCYNSFIRKNVAEIFLNDYDVIDVFDNDRSAIMSRIDYIERNEPRRSFLNIF